MPILNYLQAYTVPSTGNTYNLTTTGIIQEYLFYGGGIMTGDIIINPSGNDVFGLTFVIKWLGTADGLVYWDNIRWAVWNNATNPELSLGTFGNIVETGNANIWFTIDPSTSPGDTELYFFDGYFFTKVLYRNDGTTLINPCNIF